MSGKIWELDLNLHIALLCIWIDDERTVDVPIHAIQTVRYVLAVVGTQMTDGWMVACLLGWWCGQRRRHRYRLYQLQFVVYRTFYGRFN